METLVAKAIDLAQNSRIVFTKFITANDTGATGGHQAGFHIHKSAGPVLLGKEGVKGSNIDRFVSIKWQDDFETESRFIYYGVGTRNEYRLTRFGRGFPFLNDDNVGDLLVLIKDSPDYYRGFVLQSDEDIDDFFAALNITSADTNRIVPKQYQTNAEDILLKCFNGYIHSLKVEFPATAALAFNSRNCYNNAYQITTAIARSNVDKTVLEWLWAEYELFKLIENNRYNDRIKTPFKSVEELIEAANTILNRRKSRAGKSLEHHLGEIFRISNLSFETQVTTEDNKKPDFLFPGIAKYQDSKSPVRNLVMLAAKTTCKDRWRQILNEADRIKTKHLFTLQQGISSNQLKEMYKYNVCLVVPAVYRNSFPPNFRDKILSLQEFVRHVASTQ